MALGDDTAEDEKEEKPKVYKSAIDSEDASNSRNSHRPVAAGVGEQDDVKQEKNDVCLEANVQPCPSTSGSTTGTGSSPSDGITKHPSKDSASTGASATTVNGASPKSGSGKTLNASAAAPSAGTDTARSTAFTRTHSSRTNGLDAFMNGLSNISNANYCMGMPPGHLAAYFGQGPSSGGSATSAHGVIHPMASYANQLYHVAATAHLMGNRFPGSPNTASSPFNFQQGPHPFAGLSPCYPTAPDGGQSAPSQAAAGPAVLPFFYGDPKGVSIRSPFGFFPSAGQCSPSFQTNVPMLMQPTNMLDWYRYASPMFQLPMMAAGAGSAQVPCSPNATLSPIVNSSPIAGGAPSLTPTAGLAPPTLIPAYPAHYAANGLRFPAANSTATNALAAMSQIPLPVVTTSVKSVASNMVASATANSAARNSLTQNGSASANTHSGLASRKHADQHHDENSMGANSISAHISNRSSHEKALKKMTHIKKPLNAFMLYMKEMRPVVMQEVGLKERQSAEINRILGRRWHSLTRDEQQKYYDMARHERTLHMQRYPNWSARDNYALHKKKKRKRDKAQENLEMKKCRARFGLDQQSKWCKHCRRKKKCLWFREGTGTSVSTASSSGIQENGTDSAEHSPPCAQVTSTTNGPDTGASSTVLAAETDVNSPQSQVTSTITIAVGNRPVPPSVSNGGSNKKKVSASATVSKNGTGRSQSPARKKRRRPESMGGDSDDEDGASSSGSDDDDASSDEFDEDEIDEEAEAAAAAKAAAEGADFDEEMAALISPPSLDHNNGLAEEGQPSMVT